MGSFKVSCALSNQIISEDDEVVMLLLTRRNSSSFMTCYNWDNYAPMPFLLEGKYSGYGTLKNISLFNSLHPKAKVSDETVKLMNQKLFEKLSTQAQYDSDESVTDLNSFFQTRDIALVRTSSRLAQLEIIIQAVNMMEQKEPGNALVAEQFQSFFSAIGVASFEELKQKAQELRSAPAQKTTIPIQYVMMKKQALMFVLNHFGTIQESNEDEDDNYYIKLQKARSSNASLSKNRETIVFVEGTKDYAGQNSPLFTLHAVYDSLKSEKSENSKVNVKEVEEFYVRQVLDFCLLNEYMNVLGKTWQPSMTLSDDIAYYGHQEAYELQGQLMTQDVAKKKKTKLMK